MRVKNNVKVIAITLAIVMLLMGLLVVLIKVSDGFQMGFEDWKLRKVNEKNLWQTVSFSATENNDMLVSGDDGISIKLTEDNALKINGTAEKDLQYRIGSATLKANTSYVFDSSFKGSNKTMRVEIRQVGSGTVLKSCTASSVVIPASSLTADTAVEVWVVIANETEVNATLKPVLCVGTSSDDLVDFYK